MMIAEVSGGADSHPVSLVGRVKFLVLRTYLAEDL